MKKTKRVWVVGYLTLVITTLVFIAWNVMKVDPYFHYHAPDTEHFFYRLDNQRSQNDGITRHFSYEGIITGTSMMENTKASEAEHAFGVPFIKVCYEGGTFHEIWQSLEATVRRNPKLKYVICGLDMDMFWDDWDKWRTDMGTYPKYLYDDHYYNDVAYLYNRDVVFNRIYMMEKEAGEPGFQGGVTSFDAYSNWMNDGYLFGTASVLGGQELYHGHKEVKDDLTLVEEERIRMNIQRNVIELAAKNPQITFYCFFPPYSAVWWNASLANGTLKKRVDAERVVIEEMLKCKNIRLYSFNCLFDITTNLNHYKDMNHYGEWINSLLLQYMREERCLLTRDHYLDYLEEEYQFYSNYDYSLLEKR